MMIMMLLKKAERCDIDEVIEAHQEHQCGRAKLKPGNINHCC